LDGGASNNDSPKLPEKPRLPNNTHLHATVTAIHWQEQMPSPEVAAISEGTAEAGICPAAAS